ncbi:hypothetical protein D9756_007801 [Leucocoprinus leucothites]|uniref:Uncharacterized protein n=1 Tax=Leucocoprinus leucothites TaxID=201217 RepID=A0A8H5FYE5_9AGAR|nr:hypothetical protein D9756_007801 [Leucoagaricus leucothites]
MSNHRRQPQAGSSPSGGDGGPTIPPIIPTTTSGITESPTDPPGAGSSPSDSTPPSTPPDDSSQPPPPSSQPPPPSSADPSTPPITPSSRSEEPTPSSTPSLPSSTPEPSSTPPPPLPSSTTEFVESTSTVSSTSFTTIVTTGADGSVITTTSALPTSLSTATPKAGQSNRVGIIAGTTTAAIVLLLITLGVIFLYRRNRLRKLWDEIALRSGRGRRERKGLLEDEDFDDDMGGGGGSSRGGVGMRMYRDSDGFDEGHSRTASAASSRLGTRPGGSLFPTSASGASTMTSTSFYPSLMVSTSYHPPQTPTSFIQSPILTSSRPSTPSHPNASSLSLGHHSPAPSLFRARASESGSMFREEGVWPPPGEASEFVDPFVGHVRQVSEEMSVGGEVGRSVLGVMGPTAANLSPIATPARSSPSPTIMTGRQASSSPTTMTTASTLSPSVVHIAPIGSSAAANSSVTSNMGPGTSTVIHDRGHASGAGIDLNSYTPMPAPAPVLSLSSTPVASRSTPTTPRVMTVPASHSRQSSSSSSAGSVSPPRAQPAVPLKSILKKSSGGGGSSGPMFVGSSKARVDVMSVSPKASLANLKEDGETSRSNTVGSRRTDTSESMYSTSTAADVEVGFGYVSVGSTPPPLSSSPQQQYGVGGGGSGGLPPGAGRSMIPGSRGVYENTKSASLPSYYAQAAPSVPSPAAPVPSSKSAPPKLGLMGFDSEEDGLGLGGEFDMILDDEFGGGGGGGGQVKMPNSQPKVSSPLARALSSDAKIFVRE